MIILKRERKEAGFYIQGERMHKLLRKIDIKEIIVQCEDYFLKVYTSYRKRSLVHCPGGSGMASEQR